MSFIHLYVDKNKNDRNLIDILRTNNLDFLEYRLSDSEKSLYNIEHIPAIKFRDKIIYDLSESNLKHIYKDFNTYVNNLPSVTKTQDLIPKEIKTEKKLTREIRLNTINIINKELLSSYVKTLSKKHKS